MYITNSVMYICKLGSLLLDDLLSETISVY